MSEEYCYYCLICGTETEPMDLPLCKEHQQWFDLEKLWKMHDNNEIDALDFEYDNVKARFVKPEYYEKFVLWIIGKKVKPNE